MNFCDQIWQKTLELQEHIQTMPFNQQLADGTLAPEIFRGYMVQDAHYLEGFARALALAAARAPDAQSVAQLAGSASGAIAVERQLHDEYMKLYGVTPEMFHAIRPSRSCDHYVSYLIRCAASAPFPVAVAALLPCFWIYHVVGTQIHEKVTEDHPYKAWIDTYSSDDFTTAVQAMCALTDRIAETTTPEIRTQMEEAFEKSSWHEWMFWQSAFEQEAWPQPKGEK